MNKVSAKEVADFIRENGHEFMPIKTNNDKMRRCCASNLARAIEMHFAWPHGRLVSPHPSMDSVVLQNARDQGHPDFMDAAGNVVTTSSGGYCVEELG